MPQCEREEKEGETGGEGGGEDDIEPE